MTNNNLNKRFFTEEDSPVPLIHTDMAWDNMHQKLKQEMPEEKKRRLFFWIPPFVYVMFTVLLTGAVVIIWWGHHISETIQVKNENGMVQYSKLKDSVAATTSVDNNIQKAENTRDAQPVAIDKNNIASSSKNNESLVNAIKNASSTATTENKHRAGLLADTITSKQLPGIHINKVKNIQQTFSPILTANDQNGDKSYLKKRSKRSGRHPEKSSRPVTSVTAQEEEDGALPFVFSQQIVGIDSISVQTDRSLPGILFQSPIKPEHTRKNAFWVEGGVQWNIPVPFDGYNYYWKGANGKDQVFQMLLPGVWLGVNKNRQRIIATVNPFVSAPMPVKDYGTGMVPTNDSMQVYAHKRMIKMFGYQAGLQYAYRITDNWWLGSGIDGNWWRKGLVLAKPVDSFSSRKPFLYTVNPKTEEKVTDFQISGNLALGYQHKAWEAVMQVSTPFNLTIKGIPSPIWLRLGVRWRLMNKRLQGKE